MIVIFRNFLRNHMVNLTATSIKFFIPNCKFYCVSLYAHSQNEYNQQESLFPFIENIYRQTKYVNNTGKPQDHEDTTMTAGWANTDNTLYFSEGYNLSFEIAKSFDEKVLFLSEDHFFTNGNVLSELEKNEFSLAYAPWDTDDTANASILCINPKEVEHLFPLPEHKNSYIESYIRDHLINQIPKNKVYAIKNRKYINYFGDGFYTNSSRDIRLSLKSVAII